MNSSPTPALIDRHRILIVDDNRAIHDDFRKILSEDKSGEDFDKQAAEFFGEESANVEKFTFDLDYTFQGKDALELVKKAKAEGRPYSVVFMDVRMPPGWDGIETTKRIWEVEPDQQIIICTAYSDYSWERMTSYLGISDRFLIIKKPFDAMEVIQCAHAMSGKWSLLEQTRRHAESLEATVIARTAALEATNQQLKTEIEERRRSEDALYFTQFSVDNAADGMFWVAPDSRLIYGNKATCKRLGYTQKELHNLSACDILPDLAVADWLPFWESLKKEGNRTIETRHLAKNGDIIPIELTVTFFHFGDDELLCVSSRDTTRRHQILQELSQARDAALESVRLKSQFLANMSHEIRTPMNGVIGMAELLSHTELSREQRDHVETIRNSADILLDIINDILDSSKIESGKIEFEDINFDIRNLVEDTLDIVARSAQLKGLELAGYVDSRVFPRLRADSGRIRQILTNIIGNAVKFTEKGEVTLFVTTVESTEEITNLKFEIRDTGIGIDASVLSQIFEPFNQADSSNTRKYGGTGLGLTICRQLVHALGGSIGVESKVAVGSLFWFVLPLKKQPNALPSPNTSKRIPENLRVLVVDDNATNREILKLQLANLSLRSEVTAGGKEALELLDKVQRGSDPFQLVILDMQMPEMDGLTLAKHITAELGSKKLPMILLSSLGDDMNQETLAAAGINSYLVKPLKQTRLKETLCRLFEDPEASHLGDSRPEGISVQHQSKDISVLLAEDNPVNQKVALLQLKQLGYTPDVANDGIEVLEALQKKHYDVILMDCQMPRMDGYTATREIRKNYSNSIRIIAMTANAMQGDREKCLDAGMDDYASKPIGVEELDRLLRHQITPIIAPIPTRIKESSHCPVDMNTLREITNDSRLVMLEISGEYIQQAYEILGLVKTAAQEKNYQEVHRLAHKLHGSSSTCGMSAILKPIHGMELATKAGNTGEIIECHQLALEALSTMNSYLSTRLGQKILTPKDIPHLRN
ncbi:response regulator [Luteolibacter algae]|uniref:histidine kinase n=1 Tax=Luteolibacter algae TaxID=454151 RepID=A0ABW5D869_9BACT